MGEVLCKPLTIVAFVSVLGSLFVISKTMVIYNLYMMRQEASFHFVVDFGEDIEQQDPSFSQNNYSGTIDELSHFTEDQARRTQVKYVSSVHLNVFDSDPNYTKFIKKFNAKPKAAIEFFIESWGSETPRDDTTPLLKQESIPYDYNSLIKIFSQSHAETVAEMLTNKKISRIKLGSFLGQNDAIARMTLSKWVKYLDFKDLSFDEAMRTFLNAIQLPLETEKIDRLIEAFAKQYYSKHKDVIKTSDSAYILAFAVLMLHTDAHSPNIKKGQKMSKDQFANTLRGINDGEDFPIKFLHDIYDKIISEEFVLDVAKRGFLEKHARPGRGGPGKRWKRRYFMITTDGLLYYFRNIGDKDPRLIIPLEGLSVSKAEHTDRPFCFVIYDSLGSSVKSAKKRSDGSLETSTHENFLLSAESQKDQESWIECIRVNTSRDPYHTVIKSKLATINQPKLSRLSLFLDNRIGKFEDSKNDNALVTLTD